MIVFAVESILTLILSNTVKGRPISSWCSSSCSNLAFIGRFAHRSIRPVSKSTCFQEGFTISLVAWTFLNADSPSHAVVIGGSVWFKCEDRLVKLPPLSIASHLEL